MVMVMMLRLRLRLRLRTGASALRSRGRCGLISSSVTSMRGTPLMTRLLTG
jgi:hypothetical protein